MSEKYKKIYSVNEALVSDELLNAADNEITKAIPDAEPGMVIYNAGQSIIKQLSLSGKWVRVALRGQDGKSAYEIAKELNPEIGDEQAWLASMKGKDGKDGKNGEAGPKGDAGTPGKDGAAGKNGASVTGLTLKKGADGSITGGTVSLSDGSSVPITVSAAEA